MPHFLLIFFALITYSQIYAQANEWKVTYRDSDNNLTIWTKSVEGSDLLAFKCSKTLQHPMAVLSEALLSSDPAIKKEFVMGLTDFRIWDREEKNNQQYYRAYTAFDLPFPFEDRDIVVESHVYLDRNQKTLTIDAKSIEDDLYPRKESTGIRFFMNYSKIVLVQTSENETQVTMEMVGSLNGWVPNWLMNFINNQWAKTTIDQLDQVIEKFKPSPNKFVINALQDET